MQNRLKDREKERIRSKFSPILIKIGLKKCFIKSNNSHSHYLRLIRTFKAY